VNTLAGKVALVTGASTGIGRAIAIALARAGADVAITFRTGRRDATAVAAEIERIGRRAAVFQLELLDPASISALARDLRDQFERIDIWINNAGRTFSPAKMPENHVSKSSTGSSWSICAAPSSRRGKPRT